MDNEFSTFCGRMNEYDGTEFMAFYTQNVDALGHEAAADGARQHVADIRAGKLFPSHYFDWRDGSYVTGYGPRLP